MRSLCNSALPSAFGMKAIASDATDSTTPAPITDTVTSVPTPSDAAANPLPAISRLTRAPSDARSSTSAVPRAVTSTAFTTSTAPAVDNTSGAAATALAPTTTDASGNADRVLNVEASPCARTGAATASRKPQAASAVIKRVFMMVSLLTGDAPFLGAKSMNGVLVRRSGVVALAAALLQVGFVAVAQRFG